MTSASAQLTERFSLRLPADFQAWLDEDCPARIHGGEFSQALTVNEIINPDAGVLWGGFMLPDTMPVMGNRYGDWICFRLDFKGGIRDWIIWRHGGGDWTSVGSSFVEALLYESVSPFAHGNAPRPSTAARWAIDFLQRESGPCLQDLFDEGHPARLASMLAWRPSLPAHRDMALLALGCPFQKQATPSLATQMHLRWDPDFVRLCFDTSSITAAQAAEIRHRLDDDDDQFFHQDWETAGSMALACMKLSAEFAWAFEIAGWAAERIGDVDAAVARYEPGMECSVFSDESVQFRSHWFDPKHGKFSAARLRHLGYVSDDPYKQLLLDGSETIRQEISAYWMRRGEAAEQDGEFETAYGNYWKSGWDVGCPPLAQFPNLLDAMSRTAKRGQADGLHELALLHRRSIPRG